MHQINNLNLEQKIGLKEAMNQEQHIILVPKLNFKTTLSKSIYGIIVTHIYLLK